IRFATTDAARQTIPWVEVTRAGTGTVTYAAKGVDATALPKHTMQCVDCHNRPAHTFERPERAVDRALVLGDLPAALPFMKKRAVELLRATYADEGGARSGSA